MAEDQYTSEKIPSVWVVRITSVLFNLLDKLRRKLAPPHVSLLEKSMSFWYSQAIYVVAKLSVADHLKDGPKSITELATATGTHALSLYRVMRALASIGVFVEDKSGRFAMTPMAESLRTDVPNSVRDVAIMNGEPWYWAPWGQILYSVQTGKSSFQQVHGMRFFEYLKKNPEAGAILDRAMASFTRHSAAWVATAYRFPQAGVVVDVGGGHGVLIAGILRHYPGLRGIVFDLPPTVEGAKNLLESQGLSGRCEVSGGDFFEGVPTGGNIYILQHVIHDWDDENALKILRNCHRAMPLGGKLLLVEMLIPRGNRPFIGKFVDLGALMMESGARDRTEAEHRGLLSAAGFDMTRIIPLPPPDSIIEAVKRS